MTHLVIEHWKAVHRAALREWHARPLLRVHFGHSLPDWNQHALLACVRCAGRYIPALSGPTTFLYGIVRWAAQDACKEALRNRRAEGRAGECSLDALRERLGKAAPLPACRPDTGAVDDADECEALLRRVRRHSGRLMVRRCVMGGERQGDVAREYGVSRSVVCEAVRAATRRMREGANR